VDETADFALPNNGSYALKQGMIVVIGPPFDRGNLFAVIIADNDW
jgi:hypothetical protein